MTVGMLLLACEGPHPLDVSDPEDLPAAIVRLAPDQAREHFTLLEKWAVIGSLDAGVSRRALYALGVSGHPRALEVVVHHLHGPLRLEAIGVLDRLGTPSACAVLAEEAARGPDPDPRVEEALERALSDDRTAGSCR